MFAWVASYVINLLTIVLRDYSFFFLVVFALFESVEAALNELILTWPFYFWIHQVGDLQLIPKYA